jgi:hypothetical protein
MNILMIMIRVNESETFHLSLRMQMQNIHSFSQYKSSQNLLHVLPVVSSASDWGNLELDTFYLLEAYNDSFNVFL